MSVNIQLHVQDALVGVNDGPGRKHRRVGDPGVNTLNGKSGSGTSGGMVRQLLLSGQSQPEGSGGNKQDVGLALHFNSDNIFSRFEVLY